MQIFGAESCKYLLFLSQCSARVILACESLCPHGERNQQTYRYSCCHSITYPSVGFGQMEAFGSDEDVADADHRQLPTISSRDAPPLRSESIPLR